MDPDEILDMAYAIAHRRPWFSSQAETPGIADNELGAVIRAVKGKNMPLCDHICR